MRESRGKKRACTADEGLKPSEKDAPGLEARLGTAHYRRRLRLEDEREREFHALLSTKFTWLKVHVIRPTERRILKVTGLWNRGRQNYLNIRVIENEIVVGERLPAEFNGFRIAHLSDLHIDMDDALLPVLAKALEESRYDICVMTGDYRNMTVGPIGRTVELMDRLCDAVKAPLYLVLGNHDFIAQVPPLERSGKGRFLLNEGVPIRKPGCDSGLWLAGIDDPVIFRTDDLGKALDGSVQDDVKILLSHSPRVYAEAEAAGVDILLAGHTHGGQICLPGGRAILNNDASPRRYQNGPWRHGRLHGYTSCGSGASGLPIRFNCPPEIVIHVLKSC